MCVRETLANVADPDQTPQNAASDQDLHCLHQNKGISEENYINFKLDTRYIENEPNQVIR